MMRCGVLWAVLLLLLAGISEAAKPAKSVKAATPKKPVRSAPKVTQPAPDPISIICAVANTGVIIEDSHSGMKRPPASMVKLIQMLLVSEGLEEGKWRLDTPITVSAHAQGMGGTQVFLKEGEVWPLEHLMRGVAIASANDAAMAVAEGLWGNEAAYLEAANARAQALGMKDSKFYSVHGLPPEKGQPFDQTTARDMLTLSLHCAQIPMIMSLTGQKELTFRPGDSVKSNTNKLLWRMKDCDGLKTGYIRAAGFCVAATAQRNGIRLVCVVMGAGSNNGRFSLAEEVLERGFAAVEQRAVIARGTALVEALTVKQGIPADIKLVASEDVILPVRKEDYPDLQVELEYPQYLSAPLHAGQTVGQLRVMHKSKVLAQAPLSVSADVALDGWRLSVEGGRAQWLGLDRKHEAAPAVAAEAETETEDGFEEGG